MGLLALIGIVLIVLALVHVIPFVLGLVLGIVLLVAGGGLYYRGHNGGAVL